MAQVKQASKTFVLHCLATDADGFITGLEISQRFGCPSSRKAHDKTLRMLARLGLIRRHGSPFNRYYSAV